MGMTPIGPGTLLAGRFRLEDLLEETGGARFWRATDVTLVRDVAVHVVDGSDPRAPALLAAARRSATVSGQHILRVLDAAVEDGVAYVVNEWGNGVSLDRMLLEEPLHPRQAAWLVREAADAIADAHRVGVAHGRLVPENVMVTDTGSVKLIGFVVDAILHGGNGDGDQKSDVTNLAALLYAALTARWPGAPASTIAAAPRDHGRVLSPRQVRAGVPRSLDRICDNVLNQADATFPIETAHEIKAALADFLGELGEGMPPTAQQSNGEATQAIGLLSTDPEATQAGMPVFVDDDTDAGWMPLAAEPEATRVQPVPLLRPDAQPPSSKSPYVGMGGGSAPVTWGPDLHPEPEDAEPGPPESPTPWLRLAGLVAAGLALLLAVVFAFNLGRDGGEPEASGPNSPGTQSPRPTSLQVAAVDDFDPFGGADGENPDSVGNTHDGKPATTWRTSTYEDGPDLTVYKPGVGLLVDLGEEKEVSEVGLNLVGSPSTVHLLAAPEGATAPPTSVDGLTEIALDQDAGPSTALKPQTPVSTRYLVVWFTGLPQVSDGYRGEVAEIVVRS
jgi:hypothetical protein